jgi:hypothetical protein
MTDLTLRLSRYEVAAQNLHDHLEGKLEPQKGYPDSPSWGYAFTALLSVAINHGHVSNLAQRALSMLRSQDQVHYDFPWEFVVYAIQQTKRLLPPDKVLPFDEHRSKGTRIFNWFLLRQVNRGWFNCNPQWTLLKLRIGKWLYTTDEGMILDEFCTRSLSYHAFCLFLLCELAEQHPNVHFLNDWLCSGVRFSVANILGDGTALWIGRGQEQIFGYGALIYALEYVHRRISALDDPGVLDRLQVRLLSFQRSDGSFPLVLRRREPESPDVCFHNSSPGWYGYNTLYDYQPFLAYLLWRTSQLEERS